MPHEVINLRPAPMGGHGLSEALALEIAKAYDRVKVAGGQIVAWHTLDVAQSPRTTQELFLVAELPDDAETDGYVSILVDPDIKLLKQ